MLNHIVAYIGVIYKAKIKGYKMEFKEKSSPYYSDSSSEDEKD